jgi:hypothetical protein
MPAAFLEAGSGNSEVEYITLPLALRNEMLPCGASLILICSSKRWEDLACDALLA